MAENSKIEWTHHTFNPWRGCTKVSPGCANCYAETMSGRNPGTLGVWGPNGTRVVAAESYWKLPVKWDREAREAGERRRVFCASLADVFEDWQGPMVNTDGFRLFNHLAPSEDADGNELPDVWLTMADVRARLFKLIDATPNLDWLLLTKRPENIRRMVPGRSRCASWPDCTHPDCEAAHYYPNVWLGTSVENQQTADHRIPHLLRVPAAVRFLSCEPLLGAVDLRQWIANIGEWDGHGEYPPIQWVIVGGESGHGARPMHPGWARSIRDQCQAAGVAFFFKQWGEWSPDWHGVKRSRGMGQPEYWPLKMLTPAGTEFDSNATSAISSPSGTATLHRVGHRAAGRLLDGREWSEFPAPR